METKTPAAAAEVGDEELTWGQLLFRRRRFWVHRRYQLRITLLVVGTTFLLLLALNLSLLAANQRSTAAATLRAPALRDFFAAQDRFQLALILLGSAAFLMGVFVLGVLESHRTAGAAVAVCRGIERLAKGDFHGHVRLRRGDNLKEVGEAVNLLAVSLADTARHQAERLESLADRVGALQSPEAKELRAEILDLSAGRRKRGD